MSMSGLGLLEPEKEHGMSIHQLGPRLGRNPGSIVDTCPSKVKLPTLTEPTASSPRS